LPVDQKYPFDHRET